MSQTTTEAGTPRPRQDIIRSLVRNPTTTLLPIERMGIKPSVILTIVRIPLEEGKRVLLSQSTL